MAGENGYRGAQEATETPFRDGVPVSPPEEASKYDLPEEEVERRRDWARRFIEQNQALFAVIAGDSSLSFQLGEWFMIDLKKGTVFLSEETFITGWEKGWSAEQIVWAVCHELAHFRDLRENSEKMLKNFEYLWRRAKELAPEVLRIFREKLNGDPLPEYLTLPIPMGNGKETVPWIENWIYGKLHKLYNGTDDMYVNMTLPLRTPLFAATGRHAASVKRLYREILFPGTDYAKSPKSSQLVDYLLRRRMVSDEYVVISDEVREALDAFPNEAFQSAGIHLEKYANAITDPASRDARDPGWRHDRIRDIIEPVWTRFFLKDLEEMKMPPPPKPNKGGKGEKGESSSSDGPPVPAAPPEKGSGEEEDGEDGEDGDGGSNPWEDDDKNPEPIDLGTIRDFIEQQKGKEKEEARKKEEREAFERMAPDERNRMARKIADRAMAERHKIDPSWAEAYGKLEESVEPYLREMEDVFEGFMQSVEERMVRFLVGGFRSGRLDVEQFIRRYGIDIAEERYDQIPWNALTTYVRKELESRFELTPNEITVRLVIDGSKSMFQDPSRIEAAKQMVVLFLEALGSFEATMHLRFRMREPLKVNTEVWMYGSAGSARVIKPLEDEAEALSTGETERVRRFRMLGEFGKERGGTCDAEPLWKVLQSITPEREERIRSGRAVELLMLTTDGGSAETSKEGEELVSEQPKTEEIERDGKKFSVHRQAMQDTRNAIEALRRKGERREAGVDFDGVIVRGIQICERMTEEALLAEYGRFVPPAGTEKPPFEEWRQRVPPGRFLNDWEAEQFQSVWGEDGANVPHPKDLAPAAIALFQKVFEGLRMKMRYYEVSEDSPEDVE